MFSSCWLGRACVDSYQGHYVLVVGYELRGSGGGNPGSAVIRYRNPSYKDRVCQVDASTFDAARKSFGTDEDLIFIYDK